MIYCDTKCAGVYELKFRCYSGREDQCRCEFNRNTGQNREFQKIHGNFNRFCGFGYFYLGAQLQHIVNGQRDSLVFDRDKVLKSYLCFECQKTRQEDIFFYVQFKVKVVLAGRTFFPVWIGSGFYQRLAQILDLFVERVAAYLGIFLGYLSLDLHMAEGFVHLHVGAGNGDNRTIDLYVGYFHNENIMFIIGVCENIALCQGGDLGVGIFDGINTVVIIYTGHNVDTIFRLDDFGCFCKDCKISVLAIIEIQNQIRIVVIHGRRQQFLHLPGVHGGIVGCAQGRKVVCIHQIGGGQEVFGHGALEVQNRFRILGADFCRCAGEHLQAVFGIQRHQQNCIFQRGIGHGSGAVLDDKVCH